MPRQILDEMASNDDLINVSIATFRRTIRYAPSVIGQHGLQPILSFGGVES